MKKPSITPGDWRHYNSKGGRIYQNWRIIDKRKVCIAKIEELPGGESEMANAQAIAALPKLLEALERCLPEWVSTEGIPESTPDGHVAAEISFGDVRAIRSALLAAGYTE